MTIGGLPCPEHGTGPSTGGLLMVGVILSVIADAIISVSLNLQKHAHNRNWDHAAGKPKRPFTRLPLWWVGMLLNVFGELGNLVAYGFAPASVVTPVGSVGVFFNAILATLCLKEPFRGRDLAGVALIATGDAARMPSGPARACRWSALRPCFEACLIFPCYQA